MIKIVILGGGFAGVSAVTNLLKQKIPDIEIILIDEKNYHLFTPSLYEVATSEEVQSNIAIPFKQIFADKIKILIAKIDRIDTKHQKVISAAGEEIGYNYLIIALGSQPAYYNIPGLQKYSTSLKNLHDAVKIKNAIGSTYHKKALLEEKTCIVIGGGGFSGTELAAEITRYKDRLAKKYDLSPDCLEIKIIQGSATLLKGLSRKISSIAQQRLSKKGVKLCFGAHIKNVTQEHIETDDGKTHDYDLLLWTGGVEGNSTAKKSGLPVNSRGQIEVVDSLQVENLKNVFAAGDAALFINPKTKLPVPQVAQVAEDQGKIAAQNIARLIESEPLKKYQYKHFGYMVPLIGHYATVELSFGITISGLAGWILQQIVFLRYLLGILPIQKAFRKWNKFEKDLA